MDGLTHILAEADENLPKLIFGLIFFAIWALSGLVSWLNKKQQEARRQRVREELERGTRYGTPQAARPSPPASPVPPAPPRRPQRIAEGIAQRYPDVLLPPAPPPLPPPVPQQQRRPVPPTAAKPKPAPRRPAKQPQQRRSGPTPVPPALPLEEAAATPAAYVNITQPGPRAKPQTVDATAVKRWLTPATLRHQFILTEILQPPLALRAKLDENR